MNTRVSAVPAPPDVDLPTIAVNKPPTARSVLVPSASADVSSLSGVVQDIPEAAQASLILAAPPTWGITIPGSALKRRRRVRRLRIAGAVAGIIAIAGTAFATARHSPSTVTSAPSAALVAVQVGTPAVDGSVQFTVTAMRLAAQLRGSSGVSTPAGKYVLVSLRVANNASTQVTVPVSVQRLVASDGTTYVPSNAGWQYLSVDQQRWSQALAPRESRGGMVVFDLPIQATPAAVILHATAQSAGVRTVLR